MSPGFAVSVLYQSSNSHHEYSLPKLLIDPSTFSQWQNEQADGPEGNIYDRALICSSVEIDQLCLILFQVVCGFRRATVGLLASTPSRPAACIDASLGSCSPSCPVI
jgi:hypothetical protein